MTESEGDDVAGDLTDHETREDILISLFLSLREEHEPNDLRPVAQVLSACYSLEASLNKLSDEYWAGPVGEPRVKFGALLSAEVVMECRDNVRIVASMSGTELTSSYFRVIVRRPDSPEFMGFSDVTFADEEHLSCLVSAIFEGIERKATHDEVLRLAFQVGRDVNAVYPIFQRLSSEFTALVDDAELNFELQKPDLEWKDRQVCLSGDLYIFKEKTIYLAPFYAHLKVTVYGDGHIRFERDRRDVASPIEAVALMIEELEIGRATPNPFFLAEQQLADDPESLS